MIFFRKKEAIIDNKEIQIQKAKQKLHQKVDKDLVSIGELNKRLSNGVTLKIAHAAGKHYGQ